MLTSEDEGFTKSQDYLKLYFEKVFKFIFPLLVIINFLFCSNENDFINDNEFLINLNNQPKIVKDCPPAK